LKQIDGLSPAKPISSKKCWWKSGRDFAVWLPRMTMASPAHAVAEIQHLSETSSRLLGSFLFEHDLRANASRLSRGKTGTHPRIKSEDMLFRIML
jgi:hypothetical protein